MINLPIRRQSTKINDGGEYREYMVYKEDDKFIVVCIGWKIKDRTRSGGSRDYYKEFDTEKSAIENYEEILAIWEYGEQKCENCGQPLKPSQYARAIKNGESPIRYDDNLACRNFPHCEKAEKDVEKTN